MTTASSASASTARCRRAAGSALPGPTTVRGLEERLRRKQAVRGAGVVGHAEHDPGLGRGEQPASVPGDRPGHREVAGPGARVGHRVVASTVHVGRGCSPWATCVPTAGRPLWRIRASNIRRRRRGGGAGAVDPGQQQHDRGGEPRGRPPSAGTTRRWSRCCRSASRSGSAGEAAERAEGVDQRDGRGAAVCRGRNSGM